MPVDISKLRIASTSLGEGADTDGVKLFYRGQTGFGIFKRFRADTLPKIGWRSVDRLIGFANRLVVSSHPTDQLLWRSCAWPTALVTEGGRPVGLIERFHGHADYVANIPDLSAGPGSSFAPGCPECGNAARWVRLGMARVRAGAASLHFDFPIKLQRLGELFLVVEALHRRGLSVGDLRDANVLVAPPQGRCPRTGSVYLIDTDSFWIDGDSANPNRPGTSGHMSAQLGTPEWDSQALARLFYSLLCENAGAGPAALDLCRCQRLLPLEHVEAVAALHRGTCRLSELHEIALEWSRLEAYDGSLYAARRTGLRFPYRPNSVRRLVIDERPATAVDRFSRRSRVTPGC
jgi:hypothetical protein